MTRIWTLTAVAAVLAITAAAPALAADDYGYYRGETCYDRDQDATGGGVVAGAIVGGAVGGPAGAVVGGALGGAAGDDSVDCRYERYEGMYYGDNRYNDRRYYDRRDGYYAGGYGDRSRDDYRAGYRDGYNDRYGSDYRLNGMDRGYHADGYYYRRSTYREGHYDRYGVWHPARDSRDRSYRPY